MKYLEWNNAIINHYFNPNNEEKEVILHFSERIIEEIGRNNFEEPEDGYVNDFYNALRQGVPGTSKDYIQRIIDLEIKYLNGTISIEGIPLNYPPYLAYFIAFILPFTSGETIDGFNSNNFYGYLNSFFREKELKPYGYKFNSRKFKEIDKLWERINYWLIEEKKFQSGYLEEVSPPEKRKYVGKFAYHILFRKEQEEKLSTIFDKEDLLPNEAIDQNRIKEILLRNADELHLKENTVKQIKNNDYFGELIVKRALKYYNNWDGTNYDSTAAKGYSRSYLVMSFDFHRITKKIRFKYFRIYTNKGIPENSKVTFNGNEIDGLKLISERYSNPIDLEMNLDEKIELLDNVNRIKYSFKPKDYYIFKNHPGLKEWVQIPKVEYNVGTTFIIAKKDFFEKKLKNWFEKIENENKKLLDDNQKTGLPNTWVAFTINSITKFPHPEFKDLAPDTGNKPKINFDRSFYDNGNFFIDKLPTVWIENTDDYDNIIAVYEDQTEIPLSKKHEEQGIYIFTDEHKKRKNIKFKLVCGEIESQRFYQLVDFKKKTNDELESFLPIRNEMGKIIYSNPQNYLKGIEPFFNENKIQELKRLQNPLPYVDIFIKQNNGGNFKKQTEYNIKHPGNVLINYLSTKGKIAKKDFDYAVFSLLTGKENEDIQKKANHLRYSLQDAGFIDYDIQNGKITVNKPHLLVKPSEKGIITFLTGGRDNKFVENIIDFCKQQNITIEIQNNIDELHPQIIYIKFKRPDIEQVNIFTNHFDLVFKKCGLYTQFALASFFPDISEWQNYIQKVENEITDFPGGFIFDIETLCFKPKPENFEKELAFTKYTNINGHKTVYRLWYNEIAYSIEEPQLGLYIYMHLFKKVVEEKYCNCKKTKRWKNCYDEREKMEDAKRKTNIIVYDKKKKYLAIPLNCRLPRNLSISIALLNGQKPEIKYLNGKNIRKGLYIIYKNVPGLFLTNTINLHLLKEGLQSLNKTTINIAL